MGDVGETGGQKALWNRAAGRGWVRAQDLLDRMYRPFEELIVEIVGPSAQVLDVGCGPGTTTLAAARRAGPAGRCVGIDIAEPMIAAASARVDEKGGTAVDAEKSAGSAPVRFLLADAASHEFSTAEFDAVISRFGVMFFDDPVDAFTRLRRATREGGRLRFVAWRDPAENPFLTAAEHAAAPLLPALSPRVANAPGPFAFAARDQTRRLLADSGWTDIAIRPIDVPCTLDEEELEQYVTLIGPVGRTLPELGEDTRAKVVDTALAAFDPYRLNDRIRYTAACWQVDASAP
ncbi:Methyltransferase type 11 [Frankia canadensis]|uniref:Methyltransferase type 11 n=1 Tax=Frankia canadensis TaxID=1836972 RepID=A0A2I2KKI2_9ACTN|nr:class I SAM-dependent methyltransferase [Frankia canadensis]SNQ46182.1 Methyltransferase type 11 [Frankia canadensis]SOU53472.1 Methyltransferase type 11 [Frankia canadensis]